VLAPLPATPFWDYARTRGLVADDMDWSRFEGICFPHNSMALFKAWRACREGHGLYLNRDLIPERDFYDQLEFLVESLQPTLDAAEAHWSDWFSSRYGHPVRVRP
jgi:hypothetical protein